MGGMDWLARFLAPAAILSPFKSTKHFVRILWENEGNPSEVLLEVGKEDYHAVLDELQRLSGKPWVDLPQARKKLVSEIEQAKGRSAPLILFKPPCIHPRHRRSTTYPVENPIWIVFRSVRSLKSLIRPEREETMKRIAKRWLLLGLLWTVLTLTTPAQVATTGQLVGAVQDQSGGVVPGVELQLQNEDTKAVLTAAASADGGFVFPTLSPGRYTLTVSKKKFVVPPLGGRARPPEHSA